MQTILHPSRDHHMWAQPEVK